MFDHLDDEMREIRAALGNKFATLYRADSVIRTTESERLDGEIPTPMGASFASFIAQASFLNAYANGTPIDVRTRRIVQSMRVYSFVISCRDQPIEQVIATRQSVADRDADRAYDSWIDSNDYDHYEDDPTCLHCDPSIGLSITMPTMPIELYRTMDRIDDSILAELLIGLPIRFER